MVAKTADLPNLRRLFIPDPDYIIIDVDLERADAQVVAWEADDDELKQIFREGFDIHTENARTIGCSRNQAKAGVHAVNYGVQAKTLAAALGVTVYEAQGFINRWLGAHPKIKDWQDRTWTNLRTTGSVSNVYGYRIRFLERINRKLLGEALAWPPQSTVAIATNHGLVNIENNLPHVELLLQVHDSLVMQTHKKHIPEVFNQITEQMQVTIPYPDPLIIPVSPAASEKSWGDIEDVESFMSRYGKPDTEGLAVGLHAAHAT